MNRFRKFIDKEIAARQRMMMIIIDDWLFALFIHQLYIAL